MLYIILTFGLANAGYGQRTPILVFDTLSRPGLPQSNAYYLSATQFNLVDTASKWTYFLDTNYGKNWKDSVRPMGLIEFWRTEPLDDSISKFIHGKWWTPRIRFEIYDIGDSTAVFKRSANTRFFSSSVPPDVGGDIIFAGDFIFLSKGGISCRKYDTGEDFCRPVINEIFQRAKSLKKASLRVLINSLPLKASKEPAPNS